MKLYPITNHDRLAAQPILGPASATAPDDHIVLQSLARSRHNSAEPLVLALERLHRNFYLTLRGRPVRDVAETDAEINMAIAPYRPDKLAPPVSADATYRTDREADAPFRTVDPVTDRGVGWPQRHPVFIYLDAQRKSLVELKDSTVYGWVPTTKPPIIAATGLSDAEVEEALTAMVKLGSILSPVPGLYQGYDYYSGGTTISVPHEQPISGGDCDCHG